MTEYTKISKELVIEDDVKDAYKNEVYGTIKIGNPVTNESYGYLDYSVIDGLWLNPATDQKPKYGNVFHIKMIKVFDKHQQKGYATVMMNYVKKKYKGYIIDTGMWTDDGAKMFMKKKGKN